VDIVLARHDNPSDLYRITVLRHRFHEFDLPRSTAPEVSQPDRNCYCGLEVSDHAPYRVLAIDDLTDPYFVVQGMPGYSNPTVMPGDRIVSIAGKSVEHISLQELHGLLRGHLHSTVDIVLARHDNPSDLYRITVLRHRFHEFDLPRSTEQNLSRSSPPTSLQQSPAKSIEKHGFVGLVVSSDKPHRVVRVDDLVDINGTLQDQVGYQNEHVNEGDEVLQIDGVDVQHKSIAAVHDLLRGEIYSTVDIMLRRRNGGKRYSIQCLRHRRHQFDSPENAVMSRGKHLGPHS